MEVAGPLGTPLGLEQWKRASPRGLTSFRIPSFAPKSLRTPCAGSWRASQGSRAADKSCFQGSPTANTATDSPGAARLIPAQLRPLGTPALPLFNRETYRHLSRVAAGFSSYDGDLSLPLGLALGSPIFPSGCEGKLGVALEWGCKESDTTE